MKWIAGTDGCVVVVGSFIVQQFTFKVRFASSAPASYHYETVISSKSSINSVEKVAQAIIFDLLLDTLKTIDHADTTV